MWAVLRFRTAFVVVCATVILAVASCSQMPRQLYRQRLAETGEPALHAVHSERLAEVMGDLNRITLERLPQELDLNVERERRARQVADLARSLGETAERIPNSVALDELSEAERVLFHRLTGKLHDQATELERAASDGDFNRMEAGLGQITSTCNACHSAFRTLPPVTE